MFLRAKRYLMPINYLQPKYKKLLVDIYKG
jgi:hypothetical protein